MTGAPGDSRRLVRRRLSVAGRDPLEGIEWITRDAEIRDASGQAVFSEPAVGAPSTWSNAAVTTAARRYLLLDGGGRRERSVRDAIERVAGVIARWAVEHGEVADEAAGQALEAELSILIAGQFATFATPVWLNVGLAERPVTAACFILGVDDSIPALLEWNKREGLIFQQGAGAGVNLSRVRSSGEPLSAGGQASGPVSFMRAADAWASTIRAGGRARRGAKLVALDVDHPDVLDFITSKAREERRIRTLVAAGADPASVVGEAAFQHTNHALRVPDEFMRAATEGDDWELRAVTSGRVVSTLPASAILRACAESAWECGDPGLQFASTIGAWHTCPNSGPIIASNPCGEYLHVEDSACNLATLNLLSFLEEDGEFDVDGFVHAVEVMLLAQDTLVSGSGYPTPETEANALRFRQVGLGYSNLAALLLTLGLAYDSDEARAWASAVTALMTGAAYRRSAELAAALGAFEEFERNREPMLGVIERHRDAVRRIPRELAPGPLLGVAGRAWDEALAAGTEHGYRNAQTTLIAPGGTVSLTMDCETTGIEPYLAFAITKHLADGGEVHLRSRAVTDGLLALGYPVAHLEELSIYAADQGHLAGAALLPDHRPVFQTALGPDPIPPPGHLRMVAAVQPFVSSGISKTVNVPAEATAGDVEALFVEAWRLGLKGVTVYRQGSKLLEPIGGPPGGAAGPAVKSNR